MGYMVAFSEGVDGLSGHSNLQLAFSRGQCSSDASIGVGYSHSANARQASDEAEELNEQVIWKAFLLESSQKSLKGSRTCGYVLQDADSPALRPKASSIKSAIWTSSY